MAIVALLGGDRFATIGGMIAILLGPAVYALIRILKLRPAPSTV